MKTKKGLCEFPTLHSFCKSQKEQDLVGYVLQEKEKYSACETCYQETKKNQWQINWERKSPKMKWFYFYDKERQKLEDQTQLVDYLGRQKEQAQRPNEHRAWFVDQSVINFLWAKGWSCCQAEARDWWYQVNEQLKRELFTSEQEWNDFKEKGIYPAQHQTNWAQLSAEEKAQIEEECWNSRQHQWDREKLLTYTLKLLKKHK